MFMDLGFGAGALDQINYLTGQRILFTNDPVFAFRKEGYVSIFRNFGNRRQWTFYFTDLGLPLGNLAVLRHELVNNLALIVD